jgi:predicted DsbA family dithiol-disulfide isomerase
MSDADPETVTVYSDYVCPFCYLGRESLARYQETREEPLQIDWHPFDLRAQKRGPDGTIDHDVDDGKGEDYYAQARENVRRLQERYDVEMTRELTTDVDSLNAQVTSVAVSERHGYDQWVAFDRAIFDALWQDGRDIGDPDVLADLAEETGLDPRQVREALDDESLRSRVHDRFRQATEQGITGVPSFVYDGHLARGAVPPDQLERLVDGD